MNNRDHSWGGMLTAVPQQREGAASFVGALGKGCEAIDVVPLVALSPPDPGLEQEGDFLWGNL